MQERVYPFEVNIGKESNGGGDEVVSVDIGNRGETAQCDVDEVVLVVVVIFPPQIIIAKKKKKKSSPCFLGS